MSGKAYAHATNRLCSICTPETGPTLRKAGVAARDAAETLHCFGQAAAVVDFSELEARYHAAFPKTSAAQPPEQWADVSPFDALFFPKKPDGSRWPTAWKYYWNRTYCFQSAYVSAKLEAVRRTTMLGF